MEQEVKPKVTVPLRTLLVDLALIAFVLVCLVAIRTMLVVEDELHTFRSDIVAQIVASRTTLQTQISELNSELDKISVNSRVLTDRIDAGITSARVEIHDASKDSQESTAKESRNIQAAITDNLAPASDSLAKMADKVDAVAPAKPVVVTVPAATVVQEPLPATPTPVKPMLPPIKEKNGNTATRILTHVFMPWRK